MLKVEKIKSQDNYLFFVELSNGKKGLFDVKPYLDKGIFTELKNTEYFFTARPAFGGVVWLSEQDFSADTIEAEMQQQRDCQRSMLNLDSAPNKQ